MARAQRIYVPNGIYHVMARGNRRQVIFMDARDRGAFVKILAEASERYAVDVQAECRMFTHYHAVVRTPRANVSEFMDYLNGQYAQYSNRRHHLTGHLFGERFKPILVDTGFYLRVLMAYVMNNPVAAGHVATAAEWKWSSCRATLGIDAAPSYLCLDWLDGAFTSASRCESQALFGRYINAPSIEDAELLLEPVAIGDAEFKKRVRARIGATLFTAAVPRAYRALNRPLLAEVLPGYLKKAERDAAILRAHVVHAYTMAEIGRYLALHPNSVSRIVCAIRREWGNV